MDHTIGSRSYAGDDHTEVTYLAPVYKNTFNRLYHSVSNDDKIDISPRGRTDLITTLNKALNSVLFVRGSVTEESGKARGAGFLASTSGLARAPRRVF